MPYHSAFEEREGADPLGAVDDLVRDDKVPRFDGFLETADCGEGDDGADAEAAEGGDVGAGGDLVGGEFVVEAMAADEGDGDRLVGLRGGVVEDGDGRGGFAPGCGWFEGGDVGEAWEVLQAGSSYDCDGDWVLGGGVSSC